MDVPSTASGVIEKIHVAKGGKVSTGDLVATVRSEARRAARARRRLAGRRPDRRRAAAAAAGDSPRPAGARGCAAARASSAAGSATPHRGRTGSGSARRRQAAAPPVAAAGGADLVRADLAPINEPGFSRAHAGPSVRKFARELGVDLARVTGTDSRTASRTRTSRRSSRRRCQAAPAAVQLRLPGGGALPAVPAVDFAQFGPVETKPLSRIQRISGPRLHASWVNIPHVTQFDEADITELEALREPEGQTAQAGGHQAHAAGLHHARLRQGAAGVPAVQLLARSERRRT